MKNAVIGIGRVPRQVTVKPTAEWGYLVGIVLGDGWLFASSSRNYKIGVSSTKTEIVQLFKESAGRLGFNVCELKPRLRERTFPSGVIMKNMEYSAVVNSKELYAFLRPLKQPDFRFITPSFIYESSDALIGFLQGFFDAEGSVTRRGNSLQVSASSKHKRNLLQIWKCLAILSISARVYRPSSHSQSYLYLSSYESRKFRAIVGFRMERKQQILQRKIDPSTDHFKYSPEIYEKAFLLRNGGLSYRVIGKKLQIPSCVIFSWIKGTRVPKQVQIQMMEKALKERLGVECVGRQ